MAKLRHFRGTPVAEGVRLESGSTTVFAVRNVHKDIAIRTRREPAKLLRRVMRIPLLRGIVRLLRGIHLFFDALSESAELEPQHAVHGNAVERGIAGFLGIYPQTIAAWVSALLLLPLAFVALYAAPRGAALMLAAYLPLPRVWTNAVVSLVRIFSFLAATGAAVHLPVFNRLTVYRGALNQVINCYECREELSAENAAQYPLCARSSDTAFLFCVLILSLALFPLLRLDSLALTLLARIAIILGVAAFANEPIFALENAELTMAARIARGPLDFFQYMTTTRPSAKELEVVVCAFQAALGQLGGEEEEDDHSGMAEERSGDA